MNEKIISWFEDLLPEIRESGDVEPTLLKFASEKNLAPALLEKIGHVYNTAKTVNYLDKAASKGRSRGDTFKVLDVSSMLEAYTKSAAADTKYSNNEFSSKESDKLSDLFKNDSVLDNLEEAEGEEYHEVKLASAQHEEFFKDSVKKANSEVSDQLIFDLTEDNTALCREISDQLRVPDTEVSFESLEKDAMFYFEGGVKQACDHLHSYLSGIGMTEKRASDAGKKRFVKNTELLAKIATVQDNLNTIAMAEDLKKKFVVKEAYNQPEQESDPAGTILDERGNPRALESNEGDRRAPDEDEDEDEDLVPYTPDTSTSSQPSSTSRDRQVEKKKKEGRGLLGDILSPSEKEPGVIKQYYEAGKNAIQDRIEGEGSYNKGQETIDFGERESRREAMLMELIISDPILSEENPDDIISIYNSIKEMSPRLAEDKNVMRVALRSAIQHEGIAPQDIKQFLEVEHDMQKVRNNVDAENKREYVIGNSEKALKQKPEARIV
jgi:hypothetical protein